MSMCIIVSSSLLHNCFWLLLISIHPHIHTGKQLKVTNLPNMHVFGLWGEAGELRGSQYSEENLRRHKEKMQTPH